MSVLPASDAWFGAGGAEPWARALGGDHDDLVLLGDGEPQPLDVARWRGAADDADLTALDGTDGPVLDAGCGPGRMVLAALASGRAALGVDVSPAAVRHCRERGLPALRRSVFEPLPREGGWGLVLLLDGNIGIGGDAAALLDRCRALLRPGGAAVVEVHPDPDRDDVFTGRLVGGDRRPSAPFRWSRTGERALLRAAGTLRAEHAWSEGVRRFVRLRAG